MRLRIDTEFFLLCCHELHLLGRRWARHREQRGIGGIVHLQDGSRCLPHMGSSPQSCKIVHFF